MGLVCAWADLNYQQGLDRLFSMSTRLDLYWPALANLGEQSVLTQEIYLQGSGNPTDDASVFGYQERWAHLRYKNSLITGKMRSTYSTPLDYWHLGRIFAAPPALSGEFVQCVPDTRIFSVTDPNDDHIFAHIINHVKSVRMLPKHSIPSI